MTRILFATLPIPGQVRPSLSVARELTGDRNGLSGLMRIVRKLSGEPIPGYMKDLSPAACVRLAVPSTSVERS